MESVKAARVKSPSHTNESVSRADKVRNDDVRLRLGQVGILELVRRRQEKWLNRLERMQDDRMTKKVFIGEIEGKRPRGRPRRKWIDNLK